MSTYFKKGDHNAICDRDGGKYKASEMRKEWNGLIVHKSNFEPRHPQDFVRGKKDDQSVAWTRSEGADVETIICATRSAVAGIAKAGCMIAGINDKNTVVPSGTFDGSL